MSTVLKSPDVFPPGTSVGAYPWTNWSTGARPLQGTAPVGSATETETVAADGTLTFSSLVANTRYVAGAQVGGVWKYVRFRTEPVSSDGEVSLGAANGTDDLATLNVILAAGGSFRGLAGQTYKISGPLVVPSGSRLDMTGCTIQFSTTSIKTNMLQNAAVTPVATASDVATTSGSAVITSATLAAVAQAGQVIGVPAAGATGGGGTGPVWFYGTVLSVAGNNITLTSNNKNGLTASATLSGATGYLFNRDSDIEIIGGTWDTGSNWTAFAGRSAAGYLSNQLRLRRIDGLKVRNVKLVQQTFTGGLGYCFGVNPADVTDFLIENIRGSNSSVAVQGNGPLARGIVRNVQGDTQDDMVAFGCVDFAGNDSEGDITSIEIESVQRKTYGSAVKLFAGTGAGGLRECRATIRSVHNGKVNIVDYAGAGAGPIYAEIEDVQGTTVNSNPAITNTATYGFVSRNPSGLYVPTDAGLLLSTCDPGDAGGTWQPGSGVTTLAQMKVSSSVTLANLLMRVSTAGATLTSGQCLLAVVDADGNVWAKTADQSAVWNSTGLKTMALSVQSGRSLTLPGGPGVYYRVVILAVGTTTPTFAAKTSAIGFQPGMSSASVAASRHRVGYLSTGGQTAIANPVTGTVTDAGQVSLPWVGVT